MSDRTAKIISYLFHPIWIPTWIIAVFTIQEIHVYTLNRFGPIALLVGLCIITTAILPIAFISILKNLGVVSSIQMPKVKERVIPYFFTGICQFFLAYLLKNSASAFLIGISPIFISIGITIWVTAIITWTGYKISLHTTGWSGFLATIFLLSTSFTVDSLPFIVALTLITGVVASARIALNAHRPNEVYSGMINGIIMQSAVLIFYIHL